MGGGAIRDPWGSIWFLAIGAPLWVTIIVTIVTIVTVCSMSMLCKPLRGHNRVGYGHVHTCVYARASYVSLYV